MRKRILSIFILILITFTLVYAQSGYIEIATVKSQYKDGENITMKVSLFDSNNNKVNEKVNLIIEDVIKKNKLEKSVQSNEITSIYLGETIPSGFWTIKASYNNSLSETSFFIEPREKANFYLQKDKLTITNAGNTKYIKTIQIDGKSNKGVIFKPDNNVVK